MYFILQYPFLLNQALYKYTKYYKMGLKPLCYCILLIRSLK